MYYAPELACSALKLAPIGVELDAPSTCCMCGRHLKEGDLAAPYKPAATFMDARSLVSLSRNACGYCLVHTSKNPMMALQKFCLTKDRAWKLYSGVNRAWMLLNLPDEPFVFAASDTKLQHLIWRTPVSLSKEYFHMRWGSSVFGIKTAKVYEVHRLSNELHAILAGAEKKKATVTSLHPFVSVEGSLTHPQFGAIKRNLLTHEDKNVSKIVQRVEQLNLNNGEILCVGILCNYQPEEPEIITL